MRNPICSEAFGFGWPSAKWLQMIFSDNVTPKVVSPMRKLAVV
jgi:hypothetical protein